MSVARYLVGDVFERLAEMPDGSVDLVLTSPPFLALRSYLPPEHPLKAKEIGTEPTPAAFLDTLLALTAEWRRLLAPHGSIAVELGDTYSGSGGAGGDYAAGGLRDGQPMFKSQRKRAPNTAHRLKPDGSVRHDSVARSGEPKNIAYVTQANGGAGWPLAKSLCLIPELYRIGLVYGFNPLTGQPSPAGQFRARNVVRWCRPNPSVGALSDKWRPATSEIVVACVGAKRYFDLDAVRLPRDRFDHGGIPKGRGVPGRGGSDATREAGGETRTQSGSNPAGAPPLDWWEIPTAPYAGSHYAAWPPALCTRLVEAMCPQRVCLVCGRPSERITEVTYERDARGGTNGTRRDITEPEGRTTGASMAGDPVQAKHVETVGWTDCGCCHVAAGRSADAGGLNRDACCDVDHWRRGVVLDPFAGSGTTLAVATGLGRDAIGIDLDPRNVHLARERVGLFLEVAEVDA